MSRREGNAGSTTFLKRPSPRCSQWRFLRRAVQPSLCGPRGKIRASGQLHQPSLGVSLGHTCGSLELRSGDSRVVDPNATMWQAIHILARLDQEAAELPHRVGGSSFPPMAAMFCTGTVASDCSSFLPIPRLSNDSRGCLANSFGVSLADPRRNPCGEG